MSTVLTMATLQSRSDIELQTLMRNAQYDLACSLTGSDEQRDALATARQHHPRDAPARPASAPAGLLNRLAGPDL